ncbi:GerMN domain-containing protein [Neobacillus sp. PS3-40]|uniref:GerMN domain-containing protein n=1 Tax=Neobacillus sp. PS3-40 TaxID=3070679 RepID=UPI0027E00520|nr:GerMN domain-containing protein [Neobacillus sp. PS3-40]WML45584.1 GerMN domain-containing protein [Neobacillus sp. PS3-40]
MNKNKTAALISAVFASSVLLSGCGLFEVQKKIDPPKDVTITKESGKISASKEASASKADVQETVKTELYLIDKDGYVVPQTIPLPKTAPVATQALEYLVADGPVSEMLPNGFRAVLPAGTEVSVNIKDGVASVDFSKEFKNYKAADEMKVLQAVTWTLTQFSTVKNVKISMTGQELTKMPVAGSPISENLSRAGGINLDTSDVMDITNTKPLTVYYIGGEEGSYYYVPVTRRVSNNEKDNVTAVVEELVKGPNQASNLVTDFMPDVKLLEAPKVENGKVTLNFNENVFGSFEEKVISQHLLDSLVLSLTEQKGIEQVAVLVKGKAELLNEKGKKITEPVTRPEKVNTGSF